ncbi:MAG: HDOD domain-containing protein [Gammaproteobacteria bacterium]|nr:HDOD domain-containing protein [Gammaproteobacteria bacterium]
MYSTEVARYKVLQLERLPALSSTVTQLLSMLSDDDLEIEDLAKVIEQDPGLTARVIGLANAAYFAQARPVITVSEAIIRVLGLQMVKTLAFSIALCGAFDASKCPGFRLDHYWFLAFGGAQLAKKLVLKLQGPERPEPDEVYLTGLLFNIGVLILVHEFPQDYAQVLAELNREPDQDVESLERELVGISSREAGEWLTHRWHLPQFIVQAIASQSTAEGCPEPTFESRLIKTIVSWLDADQEESLVDLIRANLGDAVGIPEDALSDIELDFIQQKEEIGAVARMLAV